MTSLLEWKVPPSAQPQPQDYGYDLDRALAAIVGVHAIIPEDGFTADTLGTERAGNGVLIDDGLVLTIGYLVAEAETVWLHLSDGRKVEGHPLAYDTETGFGLVQALGRFGLPSLEIGSAAPLDVGHRVVVGGAGGRTRSVAARIVAKQEFAGYWEYALDEAIFTYPAHPHWGGAGLIGPDGKLAGIGSLQVERASESARGGSEHLNMIVPIDLVKPILHDLTRFGRVDKPARPWLGIYSTEVDDKIVLVGTAPRGPAARAELQSGDVVLEVAGRPVTSLGELYHAIWALGDAGVEVPLTLYRDGVVFNVSVNSSDRARFLKTPRMH